MEQIEPWMDRLKQKLGEHSEPLPASGWERLERELPSVPVKRMRPYRRWMQMAAAVAALIAVSTAAYLLWNTPPASVPLTTPLAVGVESAPLEQPLPAVVEKAPQKAPSRDDRLAQARPAAIPLAKRPVGEAVAIATDRGEESAVVDADNRAAEKAADVPAEQPREESKAPSHRYHPSSKDKYQLPVEESPKRKGTWSMGVSAGNAISGSSDNGSGIASMSRMNVASDNGVMEVPRGQEVVFEDGVPYLLSDRSAADIKHHQPVSVGISVRKALPHGFSVETGLTYTLLASDVTMAGSSRAIDQKLHYIGIPLRANWNFLDKKLFTLYVSAGGMVEKCVYGKLGSEKQTVKPLQFSVTGGVGAQLNATRHIGLYVEPGVAYFFNDGSDVQTIRKDSPFNFNLQAGLRFTY